MAVSFGYLKHLWARETEEIQFRKRVSHFDLGFPQSHLYVTSQDDDCGHDKGDHCVESSVVDGVGIDEFGETSRQFRHKLKGSDSSGQRRNGQEEHYAPAKAQADEHPPWIYNSAVVQRGRYGIEPITIQATRGPHGHWIEEGQEQALHCAGPVHIV